MESWLRQSIFNHSSIYLNETSWQKVPEVLVLPTPNLWLIPSLMLPQSCWGVVSSAPEQETPLCSFFQRAEWKGVLLEVILMEYKLPSLGTQDHTRSLPLLHFKQRSTLSHSVSISEFTTFFKVSCAADFMLVSADTNAWWHFVNLPHKV